MDSVDIPVPRRVVRTWAGGRDGQLHAVLILDGHGEAYCAAPLLGAGTAGDGDAALAAHEECLALELTRIALSVTRPPAV